MTPFNVTRIRADFPILQRRINDKPLIYFDNAASSQKPLQVINAMSDYYLHSHANVHRGAHTLSSEATQLYEQAREKVAAFINAPTADSIIFTRNTTEAMNLIAYSWGVSHLNAGDEVIVSVSEHHANLVPWHLIQAQTGVVIKAIEINVDGTLNQAHYASLLTPKTKAVSIAQMSNVTGVIHPVKDMAALAHAQGAIMIVDGAQSTPHMPVDVQDLDADFFALSGHKMCGPTGAGALYAKPDILATMPPFLGGGEMIRKVTVETSSYAQPPMRFEAGTPNIAEAIALGAACDYLSNIGMQHIHQYDQMLLNYALELLADVEGVSVYTQAGENRGGIIPFNIDGVHPHDVATALDQEGIAVRAGHHCAQPLMKAMQQQSTARASFYLYNTTDEIDVFVKVLKETRDFFVS